MKFLYRGFVFLFFVLLASLQAAPQDGKLIFAIDVIRHGDRNPIISLPKAPHDWPEGLGELTPLGMHQEYELGRKLRRRYIDEAKLLPRSYDPATLYVRSTDYNRTMMSAECFLMGLYPPGTGPTFSSRFGLNQSALPYRYQVIPIHTLPQSEDHLLIPHNDKKELMQFLSTVPEYQQKEMELKPYFKGWSEATGISIRTCYDLEIVGDLLFIYQLKHLPLPKGLSKKDAAMIIRDSKTIFKKSIVAEAPCQELLDEITHHLKEATAQNVPSSKLSYLLYSAHDSTIMALMNAMGASIKEVPHYASDLNISLFVRGRDDYYIQVSLNDEKIKTCSLKDFSRSKERLGKG